jgi:signal transduction histidine kinase
LKFPGVHGIRNLSLKGRFLIASGGLLLLAVVFSSFLLWDLHRTAVRGAELAIQSQEQIVVASQLREVLNDIDRRARTGEYPADQIQQFVGLENRALQRQREEASFALRSRFNAYVDALKLNARGSTVTPTRNRYEDALASINGIIENNQAETYRLAEKLRSDQRRSVRMAIFFLGTFILILFAASYKIISVITRPLSSLVRFLDDVDVEDDLPSSIPRFNSEVPEVQHVARSFEQLLARLRGYRALNVRRLLIEKRRAEVIAASITDGVFLVRNDEILYVNPVGERILGASVVRSFNLTQRQDMPGARAVLSAISRSMPVEFSLDGPEGKSYFLIHAYPIDNDVIEQAEHSVGSPVDELLDRFQADMLVVAQDVTLVRESEEAKRHFLGTLSHEVRTPVTSLTMATRLLKRGLDQFENPTHKALITTCIDDVERLRGLVEDLVTVSRFETLTQRMNVRPVDFGKLVRHQVQSFQTDAKERGIELTCRLTQPGVPIPVSLDATKVSWAVSNLLINALRHTPPKGKIETEVEAFEDRVEFRVRDTGPGIDRKRQSRIFDKFNPHYDLRVARTGGAGVGLAIAREIVAAHGGRIWVSSEPGQGAQFAFTLPLKPANGQSMALEPGQEREERVSTGLKNQMESMKGATRGTPASS